MTRISQNLLKTMWTPFARKCLLVPAAAAALGVPSVASADRYDRPHNDINVDIRVGERRPGPRYEERRARVWVPAEYRTVTDRRWCEPVYRTVSDRRWAEPVYRAECERVWVPDVYETREVRYRGPRGWAARTERVLVRPGHSEERERRVCVSEGRWEACDRRELVSEGRWESVQRQELVCEGHYEFRTERVAVNDRPSPLEVVNPVLGGLGVRVGR